MAKKRHRDLEKAVGLPQVGALLVLAAMFLPGARQMVPSTGVLVAGVVTLGASIALSMILRMRAARNPPLEADKGGEIIPLIRGPGRLAAIGNLMEEIRRIQWCHFERLVAHAYRKLGYSVVKTGGTSPDGSIDLILEKKGQQFAVQCRQWKTWNVGAEALMEFLAALVDAGIPRGIFVTVCGCTNEAKQLADLHGVHLVTEAGLALMLEATGAGSDPETLQILRDAGIKSLNSAGECDWGSQQIGAT